MSIVNTAFAPSFSGIYSAAAGTVNSVTATLISVTCAEATPDMAFVVSPTAALAAGVALGAPYCTTKGTLVVPFINPTAGNVTVGTVSLKVVGL